MESSCKLDTCKKHGKVRRGNQRFRYLLCGQTFVIVTEKKPLGPIRVEKHKAKLVRWMLTEGMRIRSTERTTGIHRDTICNPGLLVLEKTCICIELTIGNSPGTQFLDYAAHV